MVLCQVEEERRNESDRTGKVHEEMAQARTQLKRIEKETRTLEVGQLSLSVNRVPSHVLKTATDT